jgi:hypothetical protein
MSLTEARDKLTIPCNDTLPHGVNIAPFWIPELKKSLHFLRRKLRYLFGKPRWYRIEEATSGKMMKATVVTRAKWWFSTERTGT